MCLDFDGHRSGGSSFDYVIRIGPYPQVPVWFFFFFKKSGKEFPYMFSHPELYSDPPIGSDRESGCEK